MKRLGARSLRKNDKRSSLKMDENTVGRGLCRKPAARSRATLTTCPA